MTCALLEVMCTLLIMFLISSKNEKYFRKKFIYSQNTHFMFSNLFFLASCRL